LSNRITLIPHNFVVWNFDSHASFDEDKPLCPGGAVALCVGIRCGAISRDM